MWLNGKVAIDQDGPWPAQISTYRWNGFAVPRFTREVMERMVPYFHAEHEHYKAQGSADACADVLWQGDTVIMHRYDYPDDETGAPYTVEEVKPDAEGYYRFGEGWTWQAIEEEWPERDQVAERLADDELLKSLALSIFNAGGSLARDFAIEALEIALAREGVPPGHLPGVGGQLYSAWRAQWREAMRRE